MARRQTLQGLQPKVQTLQGIAGWQACAGASVTAPAACSRLSLRLQLCKSYAADEWTRAVRKSGLRNRLRWPKRSQGLVLMRLGLQCSQRSVRLGGGASSKDADYKRLAVGVGGVGATQCNTIISYAAASIGAGRGHER